MRRQNAIKSVVVMLAIVVSALFCSIIYAIPPPQGRLNDFANVLTPETKAAIQQVIEGLEKDAGVELAVVTVTSLEEKSLEDYASDLFKQWGIGKKGIDNGLLFMKLVTEDPKQKGTTRLEVGYGLEGVFTDMAGGMILDKYVMPNFFEGKYNEGFLEGVKAIDQYLREKGVTLEGIQAGTFKPSNEVPLAAKIFIFFFLIPFFFVGGRMIGNAFSKETKASKFKTIFNLIFGSVWLIIPSIIGGAMLGVWFVAELALVVYFIYAGYKYGGIKSGTGAGKYFSSSSSFFSSGGRGGSGSSGGGGFGGGSSGGGGVSR